MTVAASSYTFEDFCLLVKEGQKADLIGGVIYMASPDNTDANRLLGWLAGLVDPFLERFELGELFTSRVAFRVADDESPEPDLAVVLANRLHLVQPGFVAGPPDLAMEIVSPESIERDYVLKRRSYQEAGVPEYWIIDPIKEKVVLLQLGAYGKYREERQHKGILNSRVLPGFWLHPDWLWQKPRPKKAKILKQIFSSRS